MRLLWRVLVVLAVFVVVGCLVGYIMMGHVRAAGAAEPEVRLSSAAAGLFAGSLAGLFAIIAVVRKR